MQAWVNDLNFMMQSVLLTAVRAADGLPKNHVSKLLLRWYRRCVLYSAFESREAGRPIVLSRPWTLGGGSFTGPSYEGLHPIDEEATWRSFDRYVVDKYLASVDEIPHHFHLHLMHAAQIVGYYHSDPVLRAWWNRFYLRCVNDMHLFPESKDAMDKRLGDSEVDWRAAEEVTAAGPTRLAPRLTASSLGITANHTLVRTELAPDPKVHADAAAEILLGMQRMPEDACDVYHCGTPLDAVSQYAYDANGMPWTARGPGLGYQQLCHAHGTQLGRGIVGYIRAPRPRPLSTAETSPKSAMPDPAAVARALAEVDAEDRATVEHNSEVARQMSTRPRDLPSEHPDHTCGLHCDGQDGRNSRCARIRAKLFPPKCRTCGGTGENRSKPRIADGGHGFYPDCPDCVDKK